MRLAQFTTLITLRRRRGCRRGLGRTLGRGGGGPERPVPAVAGALIKNVRQDSAAQGIAKWKADGAYGVTADKLGRVDLAITVVEPTVTVEFITPLALHGTLKLVKSNVLEGTLTLSGGGRAYRIHLERRE